MSSIGRRFLNQLIIPTATGLAVVMGAASGARRLQGQPWVPFRGDYIGSEKAAATPGLRSKICPTKQAHYALVEWSRLSNVATLLRRRTGRQ